MATVSAPAVPDFTAFPARALRVLAAPAAFFREMPRAGGFIDPLAFVIAIGLVNGLIAAFGSLFTPAAPLSSAVGALVVTPLVAAVGSFIAGGVLFLVWRILGSRQDFEAAYRCLAAIYVITPIAGLLGLIPGLALVGTLVALGWTLYLTVRASVEVHAIAAKTAWAVFGVLAALLAVSAISVQLAANRLQGELRGTYQELQELQQLQQQLEREY